MRPRSRQASRNLLLSSRVGNNDISGETISDFCKGFFYAFDHSGETANMPRLPIGQRRAIRRDWFASLNLEVSRSDKGSTGRQSTLASFSPEIKIDRVQLSLEPALKILSLPYIQRLVFAP